MTELHSLALVLEIAKTILPTRLYEIILLNSLEWVVQMYSREDAMTGLKNLSDEDKAELEELYAALY
jgi:hypothetical protein